jgi:HSP20 family molecular chaperone IbpA
MQVDIQDKDNEIVIKADTPGLTGADLTVRRDADTVLDTCK